MIITKVIGNQILRQVSPVLLLNSLRFTSNLLPIQNQAWIYPLQRTTISQFASTKPSTIRSHKNKISKQTIHPLIEKILKIGQGKNNSIENVENILMDVPLLNKENREYAMTLLVGKLSSGEISMKLIQNERFQAEIYKYQHLQIDVNLLIIQAMVQELPNEMNKFHESRSEKKIVLKKKYIKEINALFIKIFQLLKKIKPEDVGKVQIIVYMNFADYHVQALAAFEEDFPLYLDYIAKAVKFYKSALDRFQDVLASQMSYMHDQQDRLTSDSKQEAQEQVFHLKEQVRTLIEFNAEVTMKLSNTVSEGFEAKYRHEKQNNIEKTQEQTRKQLRIQLITLKKYFKNSIESYKNIEDLHIFSQFYHTLDKTYVEIQYYQNLELAFNSPQQEQPQKIAIIEKNKLEDFEKFYIRTLSDLQIFQKSQEFDLKKIVNVCQILLNVRLHIAAINLKIADHREDLRSYLMGDVQKILNSFKDLAQHRKDICTQLMKIVEGMLPEEVQERETRSRRIGRKK